MQLRSPTFRALKATQFLVYLRHEFNLKQKNIPKKLQCTKPEKSVGHQKPLENYWTFPNPKIFDQNPTQSVGSKC